MSKVRVYIKPFETPTSFVDEWIEVTQDVTNKNLGNITAKLEGSEYDVGIFTFSNLNIKLNNYSGLYSEATDIRSIFNFRRNGSRIKITWQKGDNNAVCGFSFIGDTYPYYEIDLFEGLLDDESASQDLESSQISFKALSLGSIFSTIEAPYASFTNGDTCKEILETCLAETTLYIDVDNNNINPKNNVVIDDIESFENSDIQSVISEVLLISNSVLYFEGTSVIVKSREESAELKQTFYGQASRLGVEDIQKISNIKSGFNRTFNLWKWRDTTLTSKSTSSIGEFGLKIKEIEYDQITNTTTQQSILDNYRTEFSEPRREFELTTYLDTENRSILDKINIDYPTPYFSREDTPIARYGTAIYGTAIYPFGEYGLVLTLTEFFKIISIKINLKEDLITYGLREL